MLTCASACLFHIYKKSIHYLESLPRLPMAAKQAKETQ
jgi:hypothetical protein